ncbi:MAG: peptidoglycan-binding protein [Saprospiraceae bacterium]|nr:peptidoglycan-binding protein [Saprospiraceae bacterium]
MKNVFLIVILLSFSIVSMAQKSKSSGCKATCTTDPVIETVEKIHYIFTGADTTGLNVKMTKITVVEGRKEMVKKRKDKDCISENPMDCFIEVMEDIPPVTMNLYTLPNGDKTKEYDIRKEKINVVKKEGGKSNEDIVCIKNRSTKLIKKVQQGLIAVGYPLSVNGILDQATNLSITDFQKSKGLAYGDLTLSTLAALGIK